MPRPSRSSIEYLLSDLNAPQRTAVEHTDGPLLVLAGPGSGKTRVITRRAAHLALTVSRPERILAITFTNKAAREMRERIDATGIGEGMTVCTFHALCARLLRIHHERAGVDRSFTIVDRDDRRKLLKEAVVAVGLPTEQWRPAAIEPDISNAKNAMRSASDYSNAAYDWRTRTIAQIYGAYEHLLTRTACLDFDDLLMRVAILLREDVELRERLEERYTHVLVDEYQDTNAAQYQIVRLLTLDRSNLCVTGDPDQSIYRWRGADIGNILSFERDYPNADVIRLEQNYRSTKRILAAADALIAHNVSRKIKSLWTDNAQGPKVSVVEHESSVDEAQSVAAEIRSRIEAGADAGEIAVFYRVNSLSRGIEEALMRAGIAYTVARGLEFYNRKEIKDVLAYLRILMNPADEVALLRIINTPPRGIGATTVKRLIERAIVEGRRLMDILTDNRDLSFLGRGAAKVRGFGELILSLAPVLQSPPGQAVERVVSESGLRAMYAEVPGSIGESDRTPLANINELASAATEFQDEFPDATVVDWLEHTALLGDADTMLGELRAVTLMTLHSAKGLEFEEVHIVGVEDGILPFRREEEEADEEEERRLCFVGMTRAKQRLTLSHARYRMLRGRTERKVRSPFLDELPEDAVESIRQGAVCKSSAPVPDRGRLPDDVALWENGTLVRHPLHGMGKIVSLEPGARRTQVRVLFQDGDTRSMILEFAPLERVDFYEYDEG